jgi:predicted metalloprotease with PDZ domain
MIQYKISSTNLAAHYFDVQLTIDQPDPSGQFLRLPAWIPGSYMIRDFARNIVEISACNSERQLALEQLDKSTYQLAPVTGPVEVNYRVYAWDLSVRGAHLDTTHGFFNGTSVFLEALGQSIQGCRVIIERPEHAAATNWKLATTLPRLTGEDFGFGMFEAADYQELIDHPVEMGDFQQVCFDACGVRHDVVLSGRFECDYQRLTEDLEKICNSHIQMFGQPAPMERYLFLVMVVGEGYGGLEHRNSTSLLCSRKNLPQPGGVPGSEYRQFLGLCSHEYFHSWNVKRIHPRVLGEAQLSHEVYTPLLWAFEGITSYYDDLALLRSGCITREQYLETLGQTITRVQRGKGRLRQSVAQSSFNAWSKFYKQDENAANAIVSYYAKGSLVALCIDLSIRQSTGHSKCLDDVMRSLWVHYLENGGAVDDLDIQQLVLSIAGRDMTDDLHAWIEGTDDLPLAELLEAQGVELCNRAASGLQDRGGNQVEVVFTASLGASLKQAECGLEVTTLDEDGAAQLAGIAAGDLIVALDGLRLKLDDCESWLKRAVPNQLYHVSLFRRDELMQVKLKLQPAATNTAYLAIADDANPALNAWLGSGA